MCGIAGEVLLTGVLDNSFRACEMAATIRHRGPDGAGNWNDSNVSLKVINVLLFEGWVIKECSRASHKTEK